MILNWLILDEPDKPKSNNIFAISDICFIYGEILGLLD